MTRLYEVYIDGVLARKHLTLAGAEKTLAKFPGVKGQIYKIFHSQPLLLRDRKGV